MAVTREIETPLGPGRAHVYAADAPLATLVLGHGFGGGIAAPDLALLARDLPAAGYTVVLVEQPWRVAGMRSAGRTENLDIGWVPILAGIAGLEGVAGPMITGGRSAGARVACRTAAGTGAAGVLALAFPLHPPGRPERSRAAELRMPGERGIPVHVIQGERDPWGSPDDIAGVLGTSGTVHRVAGAHGFTRSPYDVVAAARELLPALLA